MIIFTGQLQDKKSFKLFKKLYKKTLKFNGQKPRKVEVGVSFVYDDEMRELNFRTRNINEPTDVLSFPNLNDCFNKKINKKTYKHDVNPENGKVFLGDIVINLNRAEEQAGSFGHSLTREICYLLVHGLLHLLGFDHMNDLDKKLMRTQEELILAKFNLKRD